jgi:hypothetical protein
MIDSKKFPTLSAISVEAKAKKAKAAKKKKMSKKMKASKGKKAKAKKAKAAKASQTIPQEMKYPELKNYKVVQAALIQAESDDRKENPPDDEIFTGPEPIRWKKKYPSYKGLITVLEEGKKAKSEVHPLGIVPDMNEQKIPGKDRCEVCQKMKPDTELTKTAKGGNLCDDCMMDAVLPLTGAKEGEEKLSNEAAELLGKKAFQKGLKAPAQDPEFCKHIPGFGKDHKALINAMKAWSKGFHKENLAQPVQSTLDFVLANNLDPELSQYLGTALWSTSDNSTPQGGEPLDDNYSIEDFSSESIEKASRDWAAFKTKAGSMLDGLDMTQVAHDFWLTRNGHGAGFWDGDYEGDLGDKLTDISKEFGEQDVVIGDDGMLYLEGGNEQPVQSTVDRILAES